MNTQSRKIILLGAVGAAALTLGACTSNGTTRFASANGNGMVEEPGDTSDNGDNGDNGGSGSGNGGNSAGGGTSGGGTSGGTSSGGTFGGTSGGGTSGGNTSGGNTSGGNTSGGNTSGGNTSGGNTSGGGTSGGQNPDGSSGGTGTLGNGVVSTVLVTGGNVVLGVSDDLGNTTTPLAASVPLTRPLTGAITRVLNDTGNVLVDVGEGRTLLLTGISGVVGDVVSIDVEDNTLITGLDGTTGAIGVSALGDSQAVGTVASLGVLNAGNTLLAEVNGVADVTVANVSGLDGDISTDLVSLALGGDQVLGDDPALISANLLENGLDLETEKVGDVVEGAKDTVAGVVETVLDGGKGGLGDVTENALNTVEDTTGGLTGDLDGNGSLLGDVVENVVDKVEDLTGGNLLDGNGGGDLGLDLGGNDAGGNLLGDVTGAATDLVDGAVGSVGKDPVETDGGGLIENTVKNLGGLLGGD